MSGSSALWDEDDVYAAMVQQAGEGATTDCSSGSGGDGSGGGLERERGSFFIETYGCQMNVSDSEVVRAILLEAGFSEAASVEEAGVVLANTCAIRERAEGKVWDRLKVFSSIR